MISIIPIHRIQKTTQETPRHVMGDLVESVKQREAFK